MHDIIHRSLVKSSVAGAVVVAVGTSASRSAPAAEEIKDVKFAKSPSNLQSDLEPAHTPSITVEKVGGQSVAYGEAPASACDFVEISRLW